MAESLLKTYDVTLSVQPPGQKEPHSAKAVSEFLRTMADAWAFQEECGESGYLHYQIRLHLLEKKRKSTLARSFNRHGFPLHEDAVRITANENKANFFYVTKDETRTRGPWSDKDPVIKYVPSHMRDATLTGAQKQLLELERDGRSIHCVCTAGNRGKSFAAAMAYLKGAVLVPAAITEAKQIVEFIYSQYPKDATGNPSPDHRTIYVDIPMSAAGRKLDDLFIALEGVKEGYIWDTRHKGRSALVEKPTIVVMANTVPSLSSIALDRWKFWDIDRETGELVAVSLPEIRRLRKLQQARRARLRDGGDSDEEAPIFAEDVRQTRDPPLIPECWQDDLTPEDILDLVITRELMSS